MNSGRLIDDYYYYDCAVTYYILLLLLLPQPAGIARLRLIHDRCREHKLFAGQCGWSVNLIGKQIQVNAPNTYTSTTHSHVYSQSRSYILVVTFMLGQLLCGAHTHTTTAGIFM